MIITVLIQLMAGHIMEVTARMDQAMAPGMQLIQAPLRSRLATDPTILAGPGITWAGRIMFGDQDIGHGIMVKESGSTDTTF